MSARFIFSRRAIFIVWVFMITSCTKENLPPVPPVAPYQPSAVRPESPDHGHGSLTIAIPENKPPYFNGATDDGIERDIIQESFQLAGRHPEFMETAGRQKKYDSSRLGIECVSTISEELKLKSESYFSDPVVTYHYTPFTLKKSGILIKDYKDLAGRTVEAFSLASSYLGEEFSSTIPKMLSYSEHQNRSSQVALLLHGRVEILVIDRAMFHFIRSSLVSVRPEDYDAEVLEVPVEKNVDFKVVCHDKAILDDFNRGLSMLHASHRYEEIFGHYLSEK
ncbi:hypothetical protein CCP3SC15_1480002 [Gammaproteobacteria bacterium]